MVWDVWWLVITGWSGKVGMCKLEALTPKVQLPAQPYNELPSRLAKARPGGTAGGAGAARKAAAARAAATRRTAAAVIEHFGMGE